MGCLALHELLPKLKVRITAIHQHGDRLYIGCANGSIQVYSFEIPEESGSTVVPVLKHVKTQAVGKRPVDQIGVLPGTDQLVVLSDTIVSLWPLPDLAKASSTLTAARIAHAFAIQSYLPDRADRQGGKQRDLLVVGCRKKVVIYGAGKTFKDQWELSLPHSPRTIVFPTKASPNAPLPESVHLLYSPTSSVLLHISPSSTTRLSVTELSTAPLPPPHGVSRADTNPDAASGPEAATTGGLSMGMGGMSLTGLGGYVGLGGKAAVPLGSRTVGGEVILARQDLGVFYSSEGNLTRQESLHWSNPPEAIAFSNPFIYSVVPILPQPGSSSNVPQQSVQVHLAPTLSLFHSLPVANPATGTLLVTCLSPVSQNTSTPAKSVSAATKVLFASTPTDKTLGLNEGSTLWALEAGDISEHIDDLVRDGRVQDAIGLVEAVGEGGLAPSRRLPQLKILRAVQQFAKGEYQAAIDTFLVFNVTPAKIIALFPKDAISGPLHVPKSGWMELFGAVEGAKLEPDAGPKAEEEAPVKALLNKVTHLGLQKKGSIDTLRQSANEETASVTSGGGKTTPPLVLDETTAPRQALEALMYFLSERRQKLTGAISTLSEPLPAESSLEPLHALPAADLFAFPSLPMSDLEPEQLLRVAQVIYTGLIKVYLVARPVLVGSLCRIENWCDVEEVEELLKEKKKFSDLIDLYQGKKMHAKALGMLHQLAKEEDDKLDRYPPTIRYLQKLGPSQLDLILDSSKWIFKEDPKMGLQIFVADEPEVEALPRREVVDFLDKADKDACVGYLEHVINALGENGADFHDKLAAAYLDRARSSLKKHKGEGQPEAYSRLLTFLVESTYYRPYKLLSKLSSGEMPAARAILLGRLGRHEEALRIYVYDLKDYTAAEAYCARIYAKDPDPKGVFLLLLKIYLRPRSSDPVLLTPALSLIATHGIRLDAKEVLDLLPPLVSMQDVRDFFIKTLRDGFAKRNEARVVKSLVGARKEEVDRVLLSLQTKRVRISDQRICPQCQKRLGGSAIAVHAPRGEVTHLHCKDAFSARLAKQRE